MRIILTGATGFVGAEVLAQALEAPFVSQVTVLGRRVTGISLSKLEDIVLDDFTEYTPLQGRLKADACIWCLGVSQAAVSKDRYVEITFDYALAAARAMLADNAQLRFCFLSGSQADQNERSAVLYGRIKGRTERELSKLSPNIFAFRPAFIKPSHRSAKRPLVARLAAPVAAIADRFTDGFSVDCEQLARCLLDVAQNGADQHILDNRTIRSWTNSPRGLACTANQQRKN